MSDDEPSWHEQAREFFKDPQGSVIGIVATWIIAGVISTTQGGVAIVMTVLEVLVDAIDILAEALVSQFFVIGEVWTAVAGIVEQLFVTVVTASGPFAFLWGALLTMVVLVAIANVIKVAIRVIPVT